MKDQPAVIWEGEEGQVREVSYAQLLQMVESCAAGLRARDLGKGTAIGIHLPMIIETVIALLAINRIGAIAVPVFSGYGVEAITSRMNAVQAEAIFICEGFPRRGKWVDSFETAFQAIELSDKIWRIFGVLEGALRELDHASSPKCDRWRVVSNRSFRRPNGLPRL